MWNTKIWRGVSYFPWIQIWMEWAIKGQYQTCIIVWNFCKYNFKARQNYSSLRYIFTSVYSPFWCSRQDNFLIKPWFIIFNLKQFPLTDYVWKQLKSLFFGFSGWCWNDKIFVPLSLSTMPAMYLFHPICQLTPDKRRINSDLEKI